MIFICNDVVGSNTLCRPIISSGVFPETLANKAKIPNIIFSGSGTFSQAIITKMEFELVSLLPETKTFIPPIYAPFRNQ